MTAEQWRPFPGFEGHYEVSDLGRVRSVERTVRGRTFPSVIRQPQIEPRGYVIATLSVDGVQVSKSVHVAVATAFLGPRPEGMHVAHNDGDPSNPRLDNLRFATPSENEADKRIHGTNHELNKTHCPKGHPYQGDNIKWESGGQHRKCRTCANARGREYKARRFGARARRWAQENGIPVARQGAVPLAIKQAYAEQLRT